MTSRLNSAAAHALHAGHVPGLVVAVARAGQPPEYHVLGCDGAGEPLAADSLFPVASITKLATALAVLRLVDEGALALDAPLVELLPDAAAAQPGVTIRTLLAHTSGLPIDVRPGAAPYSPGLSWEALALACLHTPLAAAPNTRVQYSNVGYGLLALAVERATNTPFAELLQTRVHDPLRIEAYLGATPARQPARVASVRGRHAGTPLEPFNSAFYRSLALPWAGMVTSAAGALALVRAFHDGTFLYPETRAAATHSQTGELGGGFVDPLRWKHCPWGLGPELRGDKRPHWAPASAGPDSFGHSGASGCLAWYAPASETAWVILGARVADNGWLLRHAPALGNAILNT